jgi:GH24 family phage-related lysozyme (muramidase)
LRKTTQQYEGEANQFLNDDVKQRLFAHEYDALVSFTYNHGSLGGTLLGRAVNDGRLDKHSIMMGFNQYHPGKDTSRRPMEIRLFTRGACA